MSSLPLVLTQAFARTLMLAREAGDEDAAAKIGELLHISVQAGDGEQGGVLAELRALEEQLRERADARS